MTNAITILITRDQNTATKTYRMGTDNRIREFPYRSGTYFRHYEYEVENIHDLSTMLFGIQEESTWMIVRGQVKREYAEQHEITRTLHDDPLHHQVGMLEDAPDGVNWMMCDFDKSDLPSGMTPQQGIENLIQTMPSEFHNASYHYQFSSSAGIAGDGVRAVESVNPTTGLLSTSDEEYTYPGWSKISVHVFFWLKHKTKDIDKWAKNLNATRGHRIIDPAPLHTVQPNYTSRPNFVGIGDPLGSSRSGFVQKDHDEVDLVWIDRPTKYVSIAGVVREVGSVSMVDGVPMIATPSLEDRFAMIGAGNEYRDPLSAAIRYYFWYHGTDGSAEEIKRLLHERFPGGIKHYLQPRHLNDLVAWYERRACHPPLYQQKKDDDALKARLVALRNNSPPFPDSVEPDHADWILELEDTGLTLYFIEGECGEGKTEWMVDRIGDRPNRYIICLPRIDLIREVSKRLADKHPNIRDTKGYVIETIYTDKENDIRDVEDLTDDEHSANMTVTEQVIKFRARVQDKHRVVLFITHAALLLTKWQEWNDYHLIVDEVPDPYQLFSRDFSNTKDFVLQHAEVSDDEANYYHLGLTAVGRAKFADNGSFDDNEGTLRSLLESIHMANTDMFARKRSWDNMAAERVQLMRLVDAKFLAPFKSVTVMGDEFNRSTLALAFRNKYGVDWQQHPHWNPIRKRKTALKDRANIFYFASKEERRGSIRSYEEGELIPKLLAWLDLPENDPGQILMTTNRKFEHLFEQPKLLARDFGATDGTRRTVTTSIPMRMWVPPKLSGTDEYKYMSNVAFFAAMRPGKDEKSFIERSLLISEDEIIRWREYNTLYQFVMRICLRLFDRSDEANIYVFDEWQAEYLRERFGGCKSYTQVRGVLGETVEAKKGGRPRKPEAQSNLQRKQQQRERDRAANRDGRAKTKADKKAAKEDAKAKEKEIDIEERLRSMMRKSRVGV